MFAIALTLMLLHTAHSKILKNHEGSPFPFGLREMDHEGSPFPFPFGILILS